MAQKEFVRAKLEINEKLKESLSPEEFQLLENLTEEWTKYCFSVGVKVNHKDFMTNMKWVYSQLKEEKVSTDPAFIFVQSPTAMKQVASNIFYVKEDKSKRTVEALINACCTAAKQQKDGISLPSSMDTRKVITFALKSYLDLFGINLPKVSALEKKYVDENSELFKTFFTNVLKEKSYVPSDIQTRNIELTHFSIVTDTIRFLIYEFYQKTGKLKDMSEDFNRIFALLKTGVFAMVTFDKAIIYCSTVTKIMIDEQNRVHAEDQSAIEFEDGTKKYVWHGTVVPEKLIETPELVTKEDLLSEQNAEVRRAFFEKLGAERFEEILGTQEMCSEVDNQGNNMYILRTKEKDAITEQYIWFYRGTCPSTGRVYTLFIPQNVAQDAMKRETGKVLAVKAWTFGMTADEFRPEQET